MAIPNIAEDAYEELGIIGKNIDKAREVSERLLRDLGLDLQEPAPLQSDDEEPLLKCIVAGQLHQLWTIDPDGEAVHMSSKKHRDKSSTSVVRHAGIFVGTPFDLEVATGGGLEVMHLVNDITMVEPTWLDELAPDLFKSQLGNIYFDGYFGTLAVRTKIKFRGRTIETSGTPVLERSVANEKLFVTLYARWLYQQLEKERQELRSKQYHRIQPVPLKRIEEKVRYLAYGAISVAELPKDAREELHKLSKLETWHDKHSIAGQERHTKGTGKRPNHARGNRSWKPEHKPQKRNSRWSDRNQ